VVILGLFYSSTTLLALPFGGMWRDTDHITILPPELQPTSLSHPSFVSQINADVLVTALEVQLLIVPEIPEVDPVVHVFLLSTVPEIEVPTFSKSFLCS